MNLLPGCRFAVAAEFALAGDWANRLQVGAGVETVDGRSFPRDCWRAPTPDELNLLVSMDKQAGEHGFVQLFQLPLHLRSLWWEMLEQSAETLADGGLRHFDAFVTAASEFLAFKGLYFREPARWEAIASDPARHFVAWEDQADAPTGLRCSLPAWAPWPCPDANSLPRLWGWINLGEEETSVVLINLPCRRLAETLSDAQTGEPPPATIGELVGRFFRECPHYPPVRLKLSPGEGFHLPPEGLILDGSMRGKRELDVLLLVSQE